MDSEKLGTFGDNVSSKVYRWLNQMTAKKSVESMLLEVESSSFKRELTVVDLLFLGIGSMIGTGIYVLSGIIAADYAGPAVILSFLMASLVASLSALCYSELSAMIPISGSAYAYTYATMGEFTAWLVGFTMFLESCIGTSAVVVGWSGYLVKFIDDLMGIKLGTKFTQSFIIWNNGNFEFSENYINLPAILIITILTILLIIGTKESVTVTIVGCMIKLIVIMIFLFSASLKINPDNYQPFIPPPRDDYFGHFGILGILKGASMAFFCFSGFDSISTISQEARHPERDIPRATIGSLTISSILYLLVCTVLIGIAPYHLLNVPHPITLAIGLINLPWLGILVGASAVLGMITSILMGLLGQSRLLYNLSIDGLLPPIFHHLHPTFKTPYLAQLTIWFLTSIVAGLLPLDFLSTLSGIGTLLTYLLVNLSVLLLRLHHPHLPRPFKITGGPYLIPTLGIITITILLLASSLHSILPFLSLIILGIIIYFLYSHHHSNLHHHYQSLSSPSTLSS